MPMRFGVLGCERGVIDIRLDQLNIQREMLQINFPRYVDTYTKCYNIATPNECL